MSQAIDNRARRAALKAGYVAQKKARVKIGSNDNISFGGFRIVNPDNNMVVTGFCYELTAQQVLDYFNEHKLQLADTING